MINLEWWSESEVARFTYNGWVVSIRQEHDKPKKYGPNKFGYSIQYKNGEEADCCYDDNSKAGAIKSAKAAIFRGF